MLTLASAISEHLKKAQSIIALLPELSPDKREDQLGALVRLAHYFYLDARKIWANSNFAVPPLETAKKLAPLITGAYQIEVFPSKVVLDIPLMLPKRKAVPADAFLESLTMFLKRESYRLPRFEQATVIFEHHYAADFPQRDIRDHDNHEVRGVLNVLERYLLVSDSACYCTNIQQTKRGDKTKTRVIVLAGQVNLEVLYNDSIQ